MDIQDGVNCIELEQFEKIESSLKKILLLQCEIQELKNKLVELENMAKLNEDLIADTLDGDYFNDALYFCITANGQDYYLVPVHRGQVEGFTPIVRPSQSPAPTTATSKPWDIPSLKPWDCPSLNSPCKETGSVDGSYTLEK